MNILVALGGNAILRENEKGTFEEQNANIATTAKHLLKLIKKGHNIVVTHGNGPQVGDILLRYELSRKVLPTMPLHVCGGESQGMMGYMIGLALSNAMASAGVKKDVACVLTRTVVDPSDPRFKKPSKPIGPFYSKANADKLAEAFGWSLVREGKKYRRVVASPTPVEIVEFDTIRRLMEEGKIVVCAGGGGVPVVRNGSHMEGVDAVIDKDRASSLLASKLHVDRLMILTDVSHVFIDYGKREQRPLLHVNARDCKNYLSEGQFEEGTMMPKVQAAVDFVRTTHGKAVIADLEDAESALAGKAGTTILP
jgi:carbamate kinase